MTSLSLITTVGLANDTHWSRISDLAVITVGGQDRLYATTRYDGIISSWNINGLAPAPLDQISFAGGLAAGRMGLLASLTTGAGTGLVAGGASNGGLRIHALDGDGTIGSGAGLTGSASQLGGLQDAVTIALPNGNQAIYGALGGRDGLGHLTFQGSGSYLNGRVVQDRADTYAAAVSDVAHIQTNGQNYIYSASSTEHGISTWVVAANGILSAGPGLGMNEGLWITAPTALATAQVAGRDYLVVGAATSQSLSVIEVRSDGSLAVRDHILDTRDSRFAGVQAVETITTGGQTYVISGGADDGITVHVLIPGGQLVMVDVIADTPAASLANISAIAVRDAGGDIDIFAASSVETGISKLRYDTGTTGVIAEAGDSDTTLTGSAGRDVLVGGAGDDHLSAGAGRDILRDGDGADHLTGGAGADIFVLAYDETPDVITDFTLGEDRLDLSGWPMVRAATQLTLTVTETGFRVTYGAEVLDVHSADGNPIDHRLLSDADLVGASRIPQVILPGFPGPYTPPPDLPKINEYLGIDKDGHGNFHYSTLRIDGLRFTNPDLGRVNGRVLEGRAARDDMTGGSKRDKLTGGGGNDALTGGKSSDRLIGGKGDDRLTGGKGDDMLSGGRGHDNAWGGQGRDWLTGGSGQDRLFGGKGGDLINGAAGADRLEGGSGNDRLYAGGGHNRSDGQAGNDRLTSGQGRDVLSGGTGRDVLTAGGGNDKLFGGTGRDKLNGGTGHDQLRGGADRDQLDGNQGADRLWGGADGDVLRGSLGNDALFGGTGQDLLEGHSGDDRLSGGSGADVIRAGTGNDRATGGTGADKIAGGRGHDTLRGDDGADLLHGGDGNDWLHGGAWHDTLSGQAGNDTLIGGHGDDTLTGGEGNDVLTGSAGHDSFVFSQGQDHVTDFVQGEDVLMIAYDAFPGRLVPSEVLMLYGSHNAGTVTLDFEDGDVLTISGVTHYASLADDIQLF